MTPVQLSASPRSTNVPSFIPASLRTLNWKVGLCFAAALVVILAYAVHRKLAQIARLNEAIALAKESKIKLAEGIDLAPDPYERGIELKPEDLKALHAFYERKGILNDERRLIIVKDFNDLGLGDLSASTTLRILVDRTNIESNGAVSDQTVTVEEVVFEVINRINYEIAKAPDLTPVRQARMVGFPTGHVDLFSKAFRWGIQPGDQDDNNSLLIRILDALVAKGYIFKRGEPGGRSVWIQA